MAPQEPKLLFHLHGRRLLWALFGLLLAPASSLRGPLGYGRHLDPFNAALRQPEALIFRDEVLGVGSYGIVVEALCARGASGVVEAVEACRGPSRYQPERWVAAAAKRAAGDDSKADEYLEVEAHMNAKIARKFPPHHVKAPYFLHYFGEARNSRSRAAAPGRPWLLWEKADGVTLEDGTRLKTLEDVLDARQGAGACLTELGFGNSPPEALQQVAVQIFSALAALQSVRIVHRDVKPENIMLARSPVTGRPQIKLVDFGSAADMSFFRKVGYSYKFSPVTPKYCAPEQFLKESRPFAFDSYSAGLTLMRLIFPSFAHDAGYEKFRDDFAAAGHDLDAWVSLKLADAFAFEKEGLEEGLAMFNTNAWGPTGWHFMERIFHVDPERRFSPEEAIASKFLSVPLVIAPPPAPAGRLPLARIFGM